MSESFEYVISLSKEETRSLRSKHDKEFSSDAIINATLGEETKTIDGYWVRASIDHCINRDYMNLKVVSDTIDGIKAGIEYLRNFVAGKI
ncbi:MAG: hypothetical protein H9893_06245 [Candidatus Niameybacter stercoravium]|nr:hypothetical protein [Candidatus Niameybacter stercoravium]